MGRSQSLSCPKANSLAQRLQKPAGSIPLENDTSFPLLSGFCFSNQIKPHIIFSTLEKKDMRWCLLFNSFKVLKRTITKSPLYLTDHFSHLIKDREAVYVFSLNFSSEIRFSLSLSFSSCSSDFQACFLLSYLMWGWGLGESHPPVPCSRRTCGVPLLLAKQPCRWTQMCSAFLLLHTELSAVERDSFSKIIWPSFFSKW